MASWNFDLLYGSITVEYYDAPICQFSTGLNLIIVIYGNNANLC